MKKFKDSVDDFFKWVKGTELVELDDIDVFYGRWFEPYGIIKIIRHEKTQLNGKSVQPPESKL